MLTFAQDFKAAGSFELGLTLAESPQDNYMTNDQTFHTPSFGDEEFDIPPLTLPPTPDSGCGGVFGNSQPLSHPPRSPPSCSQLGGSPVGGMLESYPQPDYSNMAPPHSMPHHTMQQYSSQLSYVNAPMHQVHPPPHLSSPPGSTHPSPGLETSEDSDDNASPLSQLMAGVKRPSPEPVDTCRPMVIKKPKVQKKKKKRDPNEPQKPVSAYALFFRDTQAAIKGQNPNASFGEVSKIVASMWDGLDVEHKNVYKKKTEAAKKEYLKALAAYRASLVSKAAIDQSDTMYSPMSPLQKKSPLLTSLMDGSPLNRLRASQHQMVAGQVWGMQQQPQQQQQMVPPGQMMMNMAPQMMNHPYSPGRSRTPCYEQCDQTLSNYVSPENSCVTTCQEWDDFSGDCVVSLCSWSSPRPNGYASVK